MVQHLGSYGLKADIFRNAENWLLEGVIAVLN